MDDELTRYTHSYLAQIGVGSIFASELLGFVQPPSHLGENGAFVTSCAQGDHIFATQEQVRGDGELLSEGRLLIVPRELIDDVFVDGSSEFATADEVVAAWSQQSFDDQTAEAWFRVLASFATVSMQSFGRYQHDRIDSYDPPCGPHSHTGTEPAEPAPVNEDDIQSVIEDETLYVTLPQLYGIVGRASVHASHGSWLLDQSGVGAYGGAAANSDNIGWIHFANNDEFRRLVEEYIWPKVGRLSDYTVWRNPKSLLDVHRARAMGPQELPISVYGSLHKTVTTGVARIDPNGVRLRYRPFDTPVIDTGLLRQLLTSHLANREYRNATIRRQTW